ncbi:hypothetical protein MPF_1735 [Methanohalophilus portucalensis FDF-1]|uniref:Uncharacterized protein n=1 Tax=Methanohalophilus portucalensis FDF-1 TaxID=523843 RepID=A0A1L9C2Q0_9EURY|nr:hypothetical protein MPF_1735 [Methanohalophilus portucalensis FDF-1]
MAIKQILKNLAKKVSSPARIRTEVAGSRVPHD